MIRGPAETQLGFAPDSAYTLQIDPSADGSSGSSSSKFIQDGFGLPLMRHEPYHFKTQQIPEIFAQPQSRKPIILAWYEAQPSDAASDGEHDDNEGGWPVLMQGAELFQNKYAKPKSSRIPKLIQATQVTSATLREAIATRFHSKRSFMPVKPSGEEVVRAPLTDDLTLATLRLQGGAHGRSQAGSGSEHGRGFLALREEEQSASYWNKGMVCETDLGVAVVAGFGGGDSPHLLTWVTRMSTGEAVCGAHVTLYHVFENDIDNSHGYAQVRGPAGVEDVFAVAEGVTGEDGTAVLRMKPEYLQPGTGTHYQADHVRHKVLIARLGASEACGSTDSSSTGETTGGKDTEEKDIEEITYLEEGDVPDFEPGSWQAHVTGGAEDGCANMAVQLISDRHLYKRGDSIQLKGYLRVKAVGTVLRAPSATATFSIEPNWISQDFGRTKADEDAGIVTVDRQFGSFNMSLAVPEEASYGDHSLTLYCSDSAAESSYRTQIHSMSVLLSDPRPPTATLDLSHALTSTPLLAPAPLAADAGSYAPLAIPISVAPRTYTGVPVGSAEVELTWKVVRGGGTGGTWSAGCASSDASTTDTTSSMTDSRAAAATVSDMSELVAVGTSDASTAPSANTEGSMSVSISPSTSSPDEVSTTAIVSIAGSGSADAPSPPLQPGDSVQVDGRWMGPAGAWIESMAPVCVTVSDTTWRLALSTSTRVPLPGLAFEVWPTLTNLSPPATTSSGTKQVRIELRQWQSVESSEEALAAEDVVDNCTVAISFDGTPDAATAAAAGTDSCFLRVPSVGRFALVATLVGGAPPTDRYTGDSKSTSNTAEEAVAVSVGMLVGRTEAEWKEAPLTHETMAAATLHSMRLSVTPTPTPVGAAKKGDALVPVVLRLHNPFHGARLLLCWGTGEAATAEVETSAENKRVLTQPLSYGAVEVHVPIRREDCEGGCSLGAVVVAPDQQQQPEAVGESYTKGARISPLLDFERTPRSLARLFAVRVPDEQRELDVQVWVQEEGAVHTTEATEDGGTHHDSLTVAAPGQRVRVKVRVEPKEEQGGDGVGSVAEVTVVVVDKAILDLGGGASSVHSLEQPFLLQRPDSELEDGYKFVMHDSRYGRGTGSNNGVLATGGVKGYTTAAATVLRRKATEPWAECDFEWGPTPNTDIPDPTFNAYSPSFLAFVGAGSAAGTGVTAKAGTLSEGYRDVELSDDDYYRRLSTDLTSFPSLFSPYESFGGGGGGMEMTMMAESAPMMASFAMADDSMDMEMGGAPPMMEKMMRSAPMANSAEATSSDDDTATTTTMAPAAGVGVGVGVRKETSFETTPLFASTLRTDSNGEVEVELHLPDNVGSFTIRAYAATAVEPAEGADSKSADAATVPLPGLASRFGGGEVELVSRRPLSLSAALPRSVRIHDLFEAGVSIAIASDSSSVEYELAVSVEVLGGGESVLLRHDVSSTAAAVPQPASMVQDRTVHGGGPFLFTFPFAASPHTIGATSLRFNASAKEVGSGGVSGLIVASDSVEVSLLVEAQQQPVALMTSMAISAATSATSSVSIGEGRPWVEGVVLPAAVRGSGSLGVTVGVGRLPAVLALTTTLLGGDDRHWRPPSDAAEVPQDWKWPPDNNNNEDTDNHGAVSVNGYSLAAALAPCAALLRYEHTPTPATTDAASACVVADRVLGRLSEYSHQELGLCYQKASIAAAAAAQAAAQSPAPAPAMSSGMRGNAPSLPLLAPWVDVALNTAGIRVLAQLKQALQPLSTTNAAVHAGRLNVGEMLAKIAQLQAQWTAATTSALEAKVVACRQEEKKREEKHQHPVDLIGMYVPLSLLAEVRLALTMDIATAGTTAIPAEWEMTGAGVGRTPEQEPDRGGFRRRLTKRGLGMGTDIESAELAGENTRSPGAPDMGMDLGMDLGMDAAPDMGTDMGMEPSIEPPLPGRGMDMGMGGFEPPMPPKFHEQFEPIGANANAGASYPELSDKRLQSNFTQLSLSGQLALARTYLLSSTSSDELRQRLDLVQSCVAGVGDGMRVQGRTAYVSQSASSTKIQHGAGGSARAASMPDQVSTVALMLLGKGLSTTATVDGKAAVTMEAIQTICSTPLLEKLVNWLAMGGDNSGRGMVAAEVALALSSYDYDASSSEGLVGSISVLVASGVQDLLLHTFGGGAGAVKQIASTTAQVSVSWAELLDNQLPRLVEARADAAATSQPPLVFATRGEGELSVTASLRFTPLYLRRDSVDRGIAVEKTIKLLGNASNGGVDGSGSSIRVARGERVEVTVQVRLTDDASGSVNMFGGGSGGSVVEVVDWLPGGLEVLDPLLFDSASSTSSAPITWFSRWSSWYSNWCMAFGFGPFETLDRSRGVRWTANNAAGGRTYTMSYQALATTTGCFGVPPTMAKVVEEEEVMGMSAAGAVEVVGATSAGESAATDSTKGEGGTFSCAEYHMSTIPQKKEGADSGAADGSGDGDLTSSPIGSTIIPPQLLAESILQLRIPVPSASTPGSHGWRWSWVERQAVARLLAWELGVDYGQMVVLTERRLAEMKKKTAGTGGTRGGKTSGSSTGGGSAWMNVSMSLGLHVANNSEASAFHASLAHCVRIGALQVALQQYHAARMTTETNGAGVGAGAGAGAGFAVVLTSTGVGSAVHATGTTQHGGGDVEVVESEVSVKDKAKSEAVQALVGSGLSPPLTGAAEGGVSETEGAQFSVPVLVGGLAALLVLTLVARMVKKRSQLSANSRAANRSVQMSPFFGVHAAAAAGAAPLDSTQQHVHLAQEGPSEHDSLTSDEDEDARDEAF
jgi:hypothetical protein